MTLIEWRKEFETGVVDVDHEHKELVGLINKLDAQLRAIASKVTINALMG